MAFFPELQYNAPKINTPFENALPIAQLQQAANQNKLAQMQFQKAEEERDKENRLAAVYEGAYSGGKLDHNKVIEGLATNRLGANIPAYLKQQNEAEASGVDLSNKRTDGKKKQFEITQLQRERSAAELGSLINDPELSHDKVFASIERSFTSGDIDEQQARQMIDLARQKDPTQIKPFLTQILMSVMKPKDLFEANSPKVERADMGGSIALLDQNPNSPTFGKPLAGYGKTASPDALLKDARSRDTLAQGNKPPAGYRYTPDGNLETIPGGPADQKAMAQGAAATDLDITLSALRDAYDRLDKNYGITSTNNNTVANVGASIASSGIGQAAGKMFGTKNQSARNDIAMTRPALLSAIMRATGMSSKQLDSNAELKLWLTTATDPTLDVESNRKALNNIETKYLKKGGAKPNKTVARTGMHNGRKVVEYSDGSVEYAK